MTLRPAQGLHFPPCQAMALRATQDLVKIPKCEPGKQLQSSSPVLQDQTGTPRGAGEQPGEPGGISGARCSGSSCTAH